MLCTVHAQKISSKHFKWKYTYYRQFKFAYNLYKLYKIFRPGNTNKQFNYFAMPPVLAFKQPKEKNPAIIVGIKQCFYLIVYAFLTLICCHISSYYRKCAKMS